MPEQITLTRLVQERNWRRTKVKELLGEPDATFVIRGTGGKTGSLYNMDRVLEAERKHTPFKSEARVKAGIAAATTRMMNMADRCYDAEIKVTVASYDRVMALSISTHGGNYAGEPRWEWNWDYRTAMNTVRHCLTNYEELWSLVNRGETGEWGYRIIKDRVTEAIIERYPWLASEEAFEAICPSR